MDLKRQTICHNRDPMLGADRCRFESSGWSGSERTAISAQVGDTVEHCFEFESRRRAQTRTHCRLIRGHR